MLDINVWIVSATGQWLGGKSW